MSWSNSWSLSGNSGFPMLAISDQSLESLKTLSKVEGLSAISKSHYDAGIKLIADR
jgi:hypothetical protein